MQRGRKLVNAKQSGLSMVAAEARGGARTRSTFHMSYHFVSKEQSIMVVTVR